MRERRTSGLLEYILEQPAATQNVIRAEEEISSVAQELDLDTVSRVYITGCGTSLNVAYSGKYAFEKLLGLPVEVVSAFSLSNYLSFNLQNVLIIVVSQSGETGATLKAVETARKRDGRIAGITNNPLSRLAQRSDAALNTRAGDELVGPKTKGYTCALMTICLLACHLGRERKSLSEDRADALLGQLRQVPSLMSEILKEQQPVRDASRAFRETVEFLFTGSGPNYGTAREAALKMRECNFAWAEAQEVEEMVHGWFASIDKKTGLVAVAATGSGRSRLIEVLQPMKEFVGPNIVIVREKGVESLSHIENYSLSVPGGLTEIFSPLLYIVPLQLFTYFNSAEKGIDPEEGRYHEVYKRV